MIYIDAQKLVFFHINLIGKRSNNYKVEVRL